MDDLRKKRRRLAMLLYGVGGRGGGARSGYIAASGWETFVPTPSDVSLTAITVGRQGFDSSGNSATVSDTVYLTKRVRKDYPNHASFTNHFVALSHDLFVSDNATGYRNTSVATSPKPVAQWVMLDQLTVGDTIHWEIIAFHGSARMGQQVVAVQVRATDGTSYTDWQTVSTPTVSSYCEDLNDVEAYIGDHTISSLTDNQLITLEARVIPWLGTNSSIRTTADFSGRMDFSPRYFYRNTSGTASPRYAYASSGGNDSSGVISATAATAEATPFLTPAGALAKVGAAAITADILWIRVLNTVAMGTVSVLTSVPQYCGAVIITRAPAVARADAVVQLGAAGMRTGLGTNNTLLSPLAEGALVFKDISVIRSGASSFSTSTFSGGSETKGLFIQWWDVNFNNNAQTGSLLASGGLVNDATFGSAISGMPAAAGNSAVFGVSSTVQHRLYRGVSCSDANRASFQQYAMVGCNIGNIGQSGYLDSSKGTLVYATTWPSLTRHGILLNPAEGVTVDRIVLANFLIEWTGTDDSFAAIQLLTTAGNSVGAIIHHVTVTGAGAGGRVNLLYSNQAKTAGRNQTHLYASVVGLACAQLNMKGMLFAELAESDGNEALMHGVGVEGLYSLYAANSPSTEHPAYTGINGSLGTSATVPQEAESAVYTSYQGSTYSGGVVAGAGGGTYTPAVGSPLLERVTRLVFGKDLAGSDRTGAQPSGAYTA